jgi:hypothetical protein
VKAIVCIEGTAVGGRGLRAYAEVATSASAAAAPFRPKRYDVLPETS